MRPAAVPILGRVLVAGPDDPVFDWLLAAGPVVLVAVALLGRSAPALALALTYVAVVIARVVYRALVA